MHYVQYLLPLLVGLDSHDCHGSKVSVLVRCDSRVMADEVLSEDAISLTFFVVIGLRSIYHNQVGVSRLFQYRHWEHARYVMYRLT